MLALLLFTPLNLNGEQAVTAARKTMADFGYRQPVRLQKLTAGNMFDKPSVQFWNIEFSSKGGPITARVRVDDGRVVGLKLPARRRGFHPSPAEQAGYRKPAAAIVDRLRGNRPVRFDSLHTNQGIVFSSYKLLIGGFPFVGSYTYAGYAVSFDAETKALVGFDVLDEAPPIDPRPARVTQAQAELAIRRYVENEYLPEIRRSGRGTPGKPTYQPAEFGYFVVTGEKRARRVWSGEVNVNITSPFRDARGHRAVLIDALTGKPLPTQTY